MMRWLRVRCKPRLGYAALHSPFLIAMLPSRSSLAVALGGIVLSFLCVLDCNRCLFVYDALFYSPNNLNNTFASKRILLTGASSGLGASIARQLCTNVPTAHVILVARRKEKLEEVAKPCLGKVTTVALDVAGNETEAAIETMLRDAGGIDVLILNAGKFIEKQTLEVDTEQTRHIMELNVMANIRIVTAVMKLDHWERKQGGGHIMVTSSLAGRLGTPVSAAYAAAKHALHGYFASLRAEMALPQLRVDIVCPGPVDTEIFAASDRPDNMKSIPLTMPGSLMKTERVSRLMLSAMMGKPAFLFRESWVARGLSLAVIYLGQYAPNIFGLVSTLLDPAMMSSYHDGQGFGGWGFFGRLFRPVFRT